MKTVKLMVMQANGKVKWIEVDQAKYRRLFCK